MRVLVCGGRDYTDRDAVWRELNSLNLKYGRLTVIQGGAEGADKHAREWCLNAQSVHMINEPADWETHGRAAGPIRNQRMIDEHRPEMVLAFPGGRGTTDMVKRAHDAGILVVRVP